SRNSFRKESPFSNRYFGKFIDMITALLSHYFILHLLLYKEKLSWLREVIPKKGK
ncbi:unnamed protein product, partial [Dovyalis caffra]